MSSETRLSFGRGNKKLSDGEIYTFSLPAGHACPQAHLCFAKVDEQTGKFLSTAADRLSAGQSNTFVCYAAKMETYRPSVRKSRWRNLRALQGKSRQAAGELINQSLHPAARRVRVHVSGDFFSEAYFLAWMDVARERQAESAYHAACTFYAYTKQIGLWLKHRSEIPENFKLIASYGGRQDALIGANNLRFSKVVKDIGEASALGLKVSPPDSDLIAERGTESFALVVH